ncbi:cAMP-dependent protein kinase catalytic subunit PRKX [Sitodiplosis mosellana]|uniref:cAMP-dependent protein kinase catalytic subunit PRKX n=1 Tax=Sitodiplosis mosellana TaxID=263140 RepID=UPI0024445459|nr:cAMP-dependent protein kinase catalytic subunit PRKX [Sitodiplosis mosellana]
MINREIVVASGLEKIYDQELIKLASKVLKTRSESFTDSDASYASSSTDDTTEISSGETATDTGESSATETNARSQNTSPSKATITRVTVPRRIVIKYSANIEQPKINPPIAIIGPQDSESSDPGILKPDFSERVDEDEDEEEEEEEEQDDEEVTTADTSELITEANPTLSQNDLDESEIEDLEEETTDEDESEEENSDDDESTASDNNIIGYTNEAQSRSCYALEDFQLLKTIGTGTFGRVCLCLDQKTNKYCAMKILAKSDVIRLKQVEHVKNEKSILTEIHHPFIVNLIWFTKDDFCLYMLFEYIVGGELFTYLRNAGKFSNSTANFYASEIILALEYLHTLSIVYRDLKPENLLIDREGHLKITDFGFAKKLKDRTWTLCGTPEYLAPEIIQSKGHNKAVDWWGLGVLIYEMLVGYPPFFADNPFGIYEKILTGKYEWPRLVDPVAKDLVKKLLVPDRTKRLGNMKNGPDDIKKHRWFKHLNWDHVYNRQVTPPIIPKIKADGDTSNFDDYPDENPKARPIPKKDMMLFDDF